MNGFIVAFGNVTNLSTYGVINIENGSKEIENQLNCSGSACSGLGVELDWGRTFWDFRTDSSGAKPHTMDSFQALIDVCPYAYAGSDNCSPGHYDDLALQYLLTFGLTLAQRFWDEASFNGTDY
ncbi:MAG: hypothetical protein AAGA54_08835 [Myxococcota bacterium]